MERAPNLVFVEHDDEETFSGVGDSKGFRIEQFAPAQESSMGEFLQQPCQSTLELFPGDPGRAFENT